MMSAQAANIELTVADLVKILERLRNGSMTDEDQAAIQAVLGSYINVLELLQGRGASIRDLRRLLGYRNSEKTRDVTGQDGASDSSAPPAAGDSPDAGASAGETTSSSTTADGSRPGEGDAAQRRKGHGRLGADAYLGAERVEVPHEGLCQGDPCPLCLKGKVYHLEPRRLVRIVGQEPFRAWLYALEQLRCNLCGEVFAAKPPPGVGEQKYDSSAAAMLALMRYGTGLPMYRLEKLQDSLNTPLPDATQWDILAEASEPMAPVVAALVHEAAQAEKLYNDDTHAIILSLLKENRTREPGKDRTGIFTTGILAESGERRIALFFTGRKHAGENLREVLLQRAAELAVPMQMCDALDRNLPGELQTILGNCLVHARRNFVDNHGSFPAPCRHVLEELGKVYANDAVAREQRLSPAQRLELHQRESAPVMDGLRAWLQAGLDNHEIEPNSGLGKATRYMLKRWDRLTLFLRAPGAPLDSNVVERALKKAILHRKNSLFYKTENGARIGDGYMSLIYTCQLNRVDPLRYLIALLENRDQVAADPSAWLPWNYPATSAA
jgi:transposase